MGRPFQRLLVLLAFATALLLPSQGRAALVPACESHQVTRMPVEWLVNAAPETPEACTPAEQRAGDVEEVTDSRVAAMCDGRGASVIAPPLVRPVADARIEAPGGCSLDLTSPVVGPSPDDSPLAAPAFALAQQAMLDAATLVPPAFFELAPPYPTAVGVGRPGIRRGIDHPPR